MLRCGAKLNGWWLFGSCAALLPSQWSFVVSLQQTTYLCRRISSMPIISMFYGIIIRMYLLDNKNHHLPHIHAKYAGFELLSPLVMADNLR